MKRTRWDELTEQFDHLPAAEACARAWRPLPPAKFGTWHQKAKAEVAYLMPLLARALDRLMVELDVDEPDWELWEWAEPPPVTSRTHPTTPRRAVGGGR